MALTTSTPPRSVFADRDFRWLYAAAAVSQFGTQVGYVAVPLVAVLVLDAGPGQVGLLGALSTLAFLVIGLPAGAWVDRFRRRRVMIAADLVRVALFASVPLAWYIDRLSLGHLYAVVLLSGAATVFFEVASQSHLPHLVPRERLPAANSALVTTGAVSHVAGRSLGGFAVQILGAPIAVALDAVSYLWSAVCVARIRRPEPARVAAGHSTLRSEIAAGVRFVLGHPLLRPIALAGGLANLSVQLYVVMLPLLFTRDLGMPSGLLGLYLAIGGVGAFLGGWFAESIGNRLGYGRALWVGGVALAPVGLLLPLVGSGGWWAVAGLGWLAATVKFGVDNVIGVSFRQRATPDDLLGRMNATFRFLLTGAVAIGAVLAGLAGEFLGVRATLWCAAIGFALVWVPIWFSPLRWIRDLP